MEPNKPGPTTPIEPQSTQEMRFNSLRKRFLQLRILNSLRLSYLIITHLFVKHAPSSMTYTPSTNIDDRVVYRDERATTES